MSIPDLLTVACSTLEDPDVSPALKAAATEAVLIAVDGGIPMPPSARRLIWAWWLANPGGSRWRSTERLARGPDAWLAAEALRVLRAPGAGDELRELAADVLCGPNAAFVNDTALRDLGENAQTGEEAGRLVRLVQAANRVRGVAPDVIETIRDRFMSSSDGTLREAAIDVAFDAGEADVAFLGMALADLDADVRTAAAMRITIDCADAHALQLLTERLRVEQHPHARAAMLRAQAAIIDCEDDRPRRRRRRI